MCASFSLEKASDVTMCSEHRFTAQTRDKDTPVLPPVFDDGAIRLETAVSFCGFDHGQGHAVFHAAGGVLVF